jgi:hypothetical protein
MPSSPLAIFLWFLGPALQLIAAVQLCRRGVHKTFSTFFTYCLFQVVYSCTLFGVYKFGTPETYFFAFWVGTALAIGLGFFVIKEAFENMLKPYAGLRDAAMLIFRWAAGVLILLSVISYVAGSGSGLARIVREIVVLERNVRFIQCGLLLFVVMCSNHLNISWKSLPCGIAFGFGLFAANDLIVSNMLASRGWIFNDVTIKLIGQTVWSLSTVIWFGYACVAKSEAKVHEMAYRPTLDRWNQAAMLIMNSEGVQPADHSYLSDIERTVEAVMAHSTTK